jgi:peptidoglycan/LPS O-acetylase OafA/YrhL
VAPPPLHPRFPLADGIRGIAAIAVLVVHSWLFTGGFGGFTGSIPNRAVVRLDGMVAIFFLLSAFLLYRPMIAHRAGGPAAPSVGDYARRRFLRIYPAYWIALTGLAIFPGLVGVFSHKWWVFYALGDYFDGHFHSTACPVDQEFRCGLPQSWTLAVEMTFYIALPLYMALTARLARRLDVRRWIRGELLLIAVLAALSLSLNSWPLSLRGQPWFEFSFAAHFFWIGLGLALAVLSVGYGHGRREVLPRLLRHAADRPGACWLAALALYVITIFAFEPAPFPVAPFSGLVYVSLTLIQGLAALLLVFPVVFSNPNVGLPARTLRLKPILWLGLISYGLYLWQVTPATDLGFGSAHEGFLVDLVGTTLFALPLAAASYYLLERPLMRLKYVPFRDLLARRMRRPAAEMPPSG